MLAFSFPSTWSVFYQRARGSDVLAAADPESGVVTVIAFRSTDHGRYQFSPDWHVTCVRKFSQKQYTQAVVDGTGLPTQSQFLCTPILTLSCFLHRHRYTVVKIQTPHCLFTTFDHTLPISCTATVCRSLSTLNEETKYRYLQINCWKSPMHHSRCSFLCLHWYFILTLY